MSDLPLPFDIGQALGGDGPAAPASARTLDDILGAPPKPRTLDDILSAKPNDYPLSSWANVPGEAGTGHAMLKAGGTLWREPVGGAAKPDGTVGLAAETIKALKDFGVFNDYEKGQNSIVRRFNETLLKPAIAGADFLLRALPSAVHDVATESPGLGPLAAAMETFPAGHFTGFPARIMPRAMPSEAAHVEPSWEGTAEPAAETAADHAVVAADVQAAAAEPVAPVLNLHGIARQIAPETFTEYDALAARKEALSARLNEWRELRRNGSSPEVAAIDAQIEAAERAGLTTDTLRIHRARAVRAIPEGGGITPEMEALQRSVQETDYQMRDLAPQVSAAYRQAAAGGRPIEVAPVAPAEAPVAEAIPEATSAQPPQTLAPTPLEVAAERPAQTTSAPAGPEAPPAPPATSAETAPVTVAPRSVDPLPGGIAGDVSRQLVAARRPLEEAEAASALVQAHYEARAANLNGGVAEDLYRADAPRVRVGRGVEPALEYAQRPEDLEQSRRGSIRLATDDAKATVTLFKDADASTFIHETGHQWLEELITDAADERATDAVRADADTVRDWLGVEEGREIPRKAHEKFARGFERYMMEGHAPTEALANVFAKFKDWLTKIYQSVARLRAPINDDIRGVFDRMLAVPGQETVIAPETPPREFVTIAPSRPRAGAFEKVPIEPLPLTEYLRRLGGVQDQGGEVSHVIGGKRFRPGLISGKGLSLDDATLRAWEEGYFPDITERPTINDLIDAIHEEAQGNKRYSAKDEGAVNSYREAMARNAEIDRLGQAAGIDPRNYNRQDFFRLASEHMSLEEQARHIGSLDAAAEMAIDEAEKRAKEFVESRGDAWEPDAVYGTGEAASLEDLENAYKSEAEALRNPSESPGGTGDAGPAAGDPGTVQGGVRQGGRGAGPPGRPSAGIGEATATPDTGAARAVELKRADWIDRLNTTDDARDIIRQLSLQTQDFRDARFGKPAYQLYHDAKAARQLLEETSRETAEAADKWARSGAEEDAAAYARSSQQLLISAEIYNEIKAGWGRAGHAFQRIDRMEAGQSVADYVKRTTGRTLHQIQAERDLAQALPDASDKAKFIAETRQGRWERIRAAYLSYFINNLISGPITHGAYAVGNTNLAIYKGTMDTAWAAAINDVREMISGKPLAERVYWSEIPAQIYGATRGLRDGFGAAGEALRTGVPYMKGVDLIAKASESGQGDMFPTMGDEAFRPQALPGKIGYVLETPSRSVTAIHTIFYSMGYEQEIARLAVRAAIREGLEGDAYNARVAEFTNDPPIEVIEKAHDEALAMVLMKRPAFQSSISALQRAVNGNVVAKTIMPFMQIGTNILDQAFIQHTPMAFLSQSARDNLLGRNGEAARSVQYGKIASGVMLSGVVIGLAAEEILTGGGPSDPHERMRKELTGWKSYSIRIGDHFFPYRKFLGAVGTLVGGVANMYEIGHIAGTGEYAQAASAAIFGFGEVVGDETWARGLADFINAARHWDRDGGRYLRNLGADFVPLAIGMGQIASLIDPYQREIHSFTDAVKNKIPGLRQTLEPRNDYWGEPIEGHTMIGPSRAVNDPVNSALIRLDIPIAYITRKVDGVGLNDQQYNDLTRVAGRLAKERLDPMVSQPSFASLPEASQRDMITKTIADSRKQARALILAQNHSIYEQAREAQKAYREGASKKQTRELLKAR